MTPAPVRRRPVGCPSDLELDELLADDLAGGPAEARLQDHIHHCLVCQERLAGRQADSPLAPAAAVLRPLFVAHAAQARTRRRRLMSAAAIFGGAAAAGVILFSIHGAGPRDGGSGERTKGALALTVHVKRAAGAGRPEEIDQVNGQGRMRAGEEMRFTLATARPGYAVVLGLDAAPSVTTYVPAAGSAQRAARVGPPGPVTLPGSVIADETPGFEKIVAVVCPSETPPETLRRQAQAALARAKGRPEDVSSLGTGCLETAVLLRKEAR